MYRRFAKHERGTIIVYVASIILAILFAIAYDIKLEAVLYYIGLVTEVEVIYLIISFIMYARKVKQLEKYSNNINIFNNNILIKKTDDIEEKYGDIIDKLYNQINNEISEKDKKMNERILYFSLWLHQIKTPIAAMNLLVENIDNSSKLESELFKIEQYAETAINYLKTENMKEDLVIDRYNLKDIIGQCVRKYSVLFIEKKIGVSMGDLDYEITTDEKWLCFVVEQILSNAIKYSINGTVKIYAYEEDTDMASEDNNIREIEYNADKKIADNKQKVCLVIEDEGIGISKEDILRVFDNGYTGLNGRRDKKASGIGLYLTKIVCDALNHKIDIESEPGKGTRVSIHLNIALRSA